MKTPPQKPVLMSPANAAAALQPKRELTFEEQFAQAKRDQNRPPPSYIEPKKPG